MKEPTRSPVSSPRVRLTKFAHSNRSNIPIPLDGSILASPNSPVFAPLAMNTSCSGWPRMVSPNTSMCSANFSFGNRTACLRSNRRYFTTGEDRRGIFSAKLYRELGLSGSTPRTHTGQRANLARSAQDYLEELVLQIAANAHAHRCPHFASPAESS